MSSRIHHIILAICCAWLVLLNTNSLHAQTYIMGSSPAVNGASISTCSGMFYDSGGANGNYGNNQNFTVTFCSATPGQQVQLAFSLFDLNNGDVLNIYNGPNTAAPLLYTCSACNDAGLTFSSSTGCLTVRFTSNNAQNTNNNVGWAASITCFSPPANDNCSSATPVSVGSSCVNTLGTNVNATASAGAAAPTCGLYSGGDVWYSFVAPPSGSVTLTASSIVGGPTDMDMALYSGTCGTLTQLDCDDFGGPAPAPDYMPQINFANLIAGQTYYVRLWEFGNNAFGNFNFCVVENGASNSNVDCSSSNQLCSDSQVSGASSGFGSQDLSAGNDGCLGLEHQSNWFYAQVTTAGDFSFSITPQVATDDYDFAVWQYPAGSSVPCPPTTQPTRCSFSAVDGATGLGNGANDNSEGAAGNGWVAPISVNVGDILVILVDNFSSTTTPFTMDFTGTSSLNCTPVPLECSIGGALVACVGATSQLTGTGLPAASNPWTSSDPSVAIVSSSGLVTGIAPGTVTITYMDSQGCQATQVFTVNARPIIGSMAFQVCTGSTFNETPSSNAPNVLPLGTTYSWSAPTGSGFTGGAAGSGASISGNLINSGAAPVIATYSVTATSGIAPNQCSTTFSIAVTVNPRPAVTAMSRVTCSGQQFTVSPVNGTNGLVPSGTIYSWSAPSGTGFSGGSSGSGAGISGTLFNTGSAPVTATYSVTAIYGTSPTICTNTFNLVVTVNPLPTAGVTSNSPICGGENAVFSITGTAGALVTYNLNGGSNATAILTGGTATVTVAGATAPQTLNLVSVVSNGTPSCTQTLSGSAVVSVNPLPTASVSSNGPICLGQNAIFTITGTTGSVVSYSLNGGATATATLVGGTATVTISAATANQSLALVSITSGGVPACSQNLSATSVVTLAAAIEPIFDYANQRFCEGAVIIQPILNTTSVNGITGIWSPAGINTASPGITDYVFTPSPGQCAMTTSFSVWVAELPITSGIFHD